MIGGIGGSELLIIFAILLLLFGAKRLPELGKGLGEGIKNFGKAYRDARTIDVSESSSKESSETEKEQNSKD